jgi:hypothetical protein
MKWQTKVPAALIVAVGLLPLAATAATPPAPNAIYGTYPENYKELITKWLNAAALDPQSLIIKWRSAPRPGELKVQGKTISGFLVDFSLNARNMFGAYTGAQKHTALIRDGQVVTATGFVAR